MLKCDFEVEVPLEKSLRSRLAQLNIVTLHLAARR